MATDEQTHYDENTLRKVYEALLEAGIFGQQAVDIVHNLQNKGILFRERKPKRRGRPPKTPQTLTKNLEMMSQEVNEAWAPAAAKGSDA